MNKLIHLTDLHFSLKDAKAVIKFNVLLKQLRNFHKDASMCIFSGDIVDDPDDTAYEFVFEGLKTLPCPVLIVAGNHDDRDQLARFSSQNVICQKWKNFIQYSYELDDLKLIVLDSNAGDKAHNDGKGYLDKGRLQWFKNIMEINSKDTILLMHHAPIHSGIKFMEKYNMLDLPDLQKTLLNYPHLRHILFGHVHHAINGHLGHIGCSSPGSLSVNIKINSDDKFITTDSHMAYGLLSITSQSPAAWSLLYQNINYSL